MPELDTGSRFDGWSSGVEEERSLPRSHPQQATLIQMSIGALVASQQQPAPSSRKGLMVHPKARRVGWSAKKAARHRHRAPSRVVPVASKQHKPQPPSSMLRRVEHTYPYRPMLDGFALDLFGDQNRLLEDIMYRRTMEFDIPPDAFASHDPQSPASSFHPSMKHHEDYDYALDFQYADDREEGCRDTVIIDEYSGREYSGFSTRGQRNFVLEMPSPPKKTNFAWGNTQRTKQISRKPKAPRPPGEHTHARGTNKKRTGRRKARPKQSRNTTKCQPDFFIRQVGAHRAKSRQQKGVTPAHLFRPQSDDDRLRNFEASSISPALIRGFEASRISPA